MGVSLQKGGNVNLSKAAPGLKLLTVGLGWDARATDGQPFDLDATAFLLNAAGKVRGDADFIYFNNKSASGVTHQGDNLTGQGDGDDEKIKVDLSKVPADVNKIAVCVTIHEADTRRQSFGQVSNAFIRVCNDEGGAELARFDLSEDASTNTAIVFGELYRDATNPNDWKFKAVGQGYNGGLAPLATNFGVNVG